MLNFSFESKDKLFKYDSSDDNDDLITFQIKSKKIKVSFSQITKYSKYIRDKYLFTDFVNLFPEELQKFQEENNTNLENIILFFHLVQQNFEIKETLNLTYSQYYDLFKISEYLQIKNFSKKIQKYFKFDTDFIIQNILHDIQNSNNNDMNINQFRISKYLENLLSNKIEECFLNEKFKDLPTPLIYRLVENNIQSQVLSNELYDFIIKHIDKFYILFQFLDLQEISENRLYNLFEIFSKSNEVSKAYFKYLPCNLMLIKELKDNNKNQKMQLIESENEKKQLKATIKKIKLKKANIKKKLKRNLDKQKKENSKLLNTISDLELQNKSFQKKQDDLKNENNQLKSKILDLESQNITIKKKLGNTEKENSQLLNTISDLELQNKSFQKKQDVLEKDNNQLKSKILDLESQNNTIKKKLDELNIENKQLQCNNNNLQLDKTKIQENLDKSKKINLLLKKNTCSVFGQIFASSNGLIFNANINLVQNGRKIDYSKSKYIISTNDRATIGESAYDEGEPIKSLKMTTLDCAGKAGTYFVRALVFDVGGMSREIVSNPVTTKDINSSYLPFTFIGKAACILLASGKYKLEVWGAEGGSSSGKKTNSCYFVRGGFGGYSSGNITLHKMEKVFVFVGGLGVMAKSLKGSKVDGGFPDGGSATCCNIDTVPGSGGGSTSICISSESPYARVIVAGGGGGASGHSFCENHYGYGGGVAGGNNIGNTFSLKERTMFSPNLISSIGSPLIQITLPVSFSVENMHCSMLQQLKGTNHFQP